MKQRAKIAIFLVLTLFVILLQVLGTKELHLSFYRSSIMMLGFLLLAGFLAGSILSQFRLPRISGYVFTGIFFGPYLLSLVDTRMAQEFKLIDALALNIIAFTAGGEFRFSTVRERMRAVSWIIGLQILLVVIAVGGMVFLLAPSIPFLNTLPGKTVIGIALLFGVVATAKSPAETIAVITETKAKGPMTELILTVTVAKDVLVILAFAIVLSAAKLLIFPEAQFDLFYLLTILWEITGSVLVGIGVGAMVIAYFRYIDREPVLFVIALAFIIVEISALTHTESLLVCLTSGIVVENFSQRGEKFIHTIEKGSLIIYVIFFVIAGANLNFAALAISWQLTLLIVGTRIFVTSLATWLGARLAGEGSLTRRFAWTGFLGQAGVSLGLAMIIQKNIPGEIGRYIATVIIAGITLNQIIGPILFRWGLSKSGETST